MDRWFDPILDSASEFWTSIADFLPKILGAIILVVVGAFVAKLGAMLTEKILKTLRVDQITKKDEVNRTLKNVGIDWNWIDLASRTVFWVIILVFGMTIADVLELNAMRDTIRDLVGYVPSVIAGAIVLTLTVAGARLLKSVVQTSLAQLKIDFAHTIGTVTQWAVIIFGAILTADQLGFDTTILTTNLTVVVAGAVLALALAFGLGGRDIAKDWMERTLPKRRK